MIPTPPVWVLDVECYINYFLVMMRNVYTGELQTQYERWNDEVLTARPLPRDLTYVTFNGNNYDMVMLAIAATGASNAQLKHASDTIILRQLRSWQMEDEFGFTPLKLDHIDLIEVAPGTKTSLKIYAGRLNSKRLQDLPIEPSAVITWPDALALRDYCGNSDCVATSDLYHKLNPMLDLRIEMGKQFGLDLRSKSDAQMAEAIIKSEVEKRVGHRVYKPEVNMGLEFKYYPPPWVQFQTPGMIHALELIKAQTFTLLQADTKDSKRGSVVTPRAMAGLRIRIGKGCYTVGIGGLHSTEKSVAHRSTATVKLKDRDVTSYYPRMIINSGICPPALGAAFMAVYTQLVELRIAAKIRGDKVMADGLKIVVNGTFGKLLSMYSVMYAPEQGMAVTITGQLAILMLIEMLHLAGFEVVSANTDGVVTIVPTERTELFEALVSAWEMATGLQTEETEYHALYSKDVNNYVAVKPDGEVKLKGLYAPVGMQKNPTNTICVDAVIAKVVHDVDPVMTIYGCADLSKFLTVRKVNGGAMYAGQYLGTAVRWYMANGETRYIEYKLNGNKVAKTDGARPLMEMPDALPADLDYQWYIDEANSILGDIGV